MTKYIWDRQAETFVPASEYVREPNGKPSRKFVFPAVIGDTPGHVSPIDGSWVEGRVARREHMKRNNVREVDPSEFDPTPHIEKYREEKSREKAAKKR